MSAEREESKDAVIKSLAIIGLIASLVVGVWLAVTIVQFIPDGFKTLASLAETVYNRDSRLSLTPEKNIVNSGELASFTWNERRRSGTYAIQYACADDIAGALRTNEGDVRIECDSPLELPPDTTTATLSFSSTERRFADVNLTLTYTPHNDALLSERAESTITIVNLALTGENTVAEEAIEGETDTPAIAPSIPDLPVPTPAPSTSPAPTHIPGYTDLAVSFVAVGSFSEQTQLFSPRTALDRDAHNGLQFDVRNIGTKTSGYWMYHVTLPTSDNRTYTSNVQAPLRSGERARITVVFGESTQKGSETIAVSLLGGGDTLLANNSFTRKVDIND